MASAPQRVVVIGSVAAGASCAAKLRRMLPPARLHTTVLEQNAYPSFANCGMPYHIGRVIPSLSQLHVVQPQGFTAGYGVDLKLRHRVDRINATRKTVSVTRLADSSQYEEPYDKLVIATGAAPIKLPLPGGDHPCVVSLRNLDDMHKISGRVQGRPQPGGADTGERVAKNFAVIGAGFIGVELAENLVRYRHGNTYHNVVDLIELGDQVLPPMDPEMTVMLREACTSGGIAVRTGDSAVAVEPTDSPDRCIVVLKSGARLPCDLVVSSVGVAPDTGFTQGSGIELGIRGAIKVNKYMQTSDPDIYAAGDCVEVTDVVTRQQGLVPLAGPANRQGRLVAKNIALGNVEQFRGTQGTACLEAFGVVVAMTGLSEKAARRAQVPYRSVVIPGWDHADYYPNAQRMFTKLLYSPEDGKILGAQGTGRTQGVVRRIDVVATMIQFGGTVYDMEELELCYSPQLGTARDNLNQAGFVAAGTLRKEDDARQGSAFSLERGTDIPAGSIVVDVRSAWEFEHEHIPGALNVPLDHIGCAADGRAEHGGWGKHITERLAQERPGVDLAQTPIIIYCQTGVRAHMAAVHLRRLGVGVTELNGGWEAWRDLGGRRSAKL
eukprot:TRINITY_DN70718_c0_g1_i1.p1 TRINITY_DN70718_c0_g1~~TRINITY_DN70718_c0_g1_i1.p1  ORF type:complete len:647 (+),score=239.20 TRINITY_DN70718_c0_g1_i1:119-1942(+)